jgi:hypothetical protein
MASVIEQNSEIDPQHGSARSQSALALVEFSCALNGTVETAL